MTELVAGNPHPPQGKPGGQFALDLAGGWRLVFAPGELGMIDAKAAKRSVFLDDAHGHAEDVAENEANRWASDCLIPPQYAAELQTLSTKDAVRDFARRIDLHPGIVVGRLQHDQIIAPSWMNDLKQRFEFEGA